MFIPPYPSPFTPDQAADQARARLGLLRGSRLAAMEAVLRHYDAGEHAAAMESLTPFLRYNPTAASASATAELWGHWVHTLLPETFEPFVERWHDWTAKATPDPEIAMHRKRGGYIIAHLIKSTEALVTGKAAHREPIPAWLYLANIIGGTGTDYLPRELWLSAVGIATHIGRTRLRNPNMIPTACLGKQLQFKGRQNFLGF